jgi:hypothetical protein
MIQHSSFVPGNVCLRALVLVPAPRRMFETVSRTLKHLEDAAAIEVPKRRRILLRNRSALRRLNA